MKKVVRVNGVSTRLIRRILQRDIAKRLKKMSDAINGDTTVFTGVQPYSAVAIAALILTFLTAEGAYSVGGSVKKSDFVLAKKAVYSCMLDFEPYVNELALTNDLVLVLSTLPLLSDEIDYEKLIVDGGIAANITARQSTNSREIVTNCSSFGPGVGYIVIVSEGMPLPVGFSVDSNGTVTTPEGNRCMVNSFGNKKKAFGNLLPKTEYFVYYVLTYGTVVGKVSAGVSVVTSA